MSAVEQGTDDGKKVEMRDIRMIVRRDGKVRITRIIFKLFAGKNNKINTSFFKQLLDIHVSNVYIHEVCSLIK